MALLRKRCWTSLFVLLVFVMCMFCLTYTGFQPLRAWTTWRQAPATVQLSPAPLPQTLYGLPSAASQAKSLQNPQNSQYSSVTTASIVSRPSVVPGTISSSFVSSESTADTGKRIFILTQSFGGQLTRAVKNMMVQQCWARDLGPDVTILEPFSHNSQLLHTPQIWESVKRGQAQSVARFSDYFDLELYNAASLKDEGAPLIKWEEFLIQAPRQAVVVVTPQGSCNHHLHTTVDRFLKDFLKNLNNMNFKILKIVPVNCDDRYRNQKLKQLLLANMHNSTIVFSSWRNYNVARTWLGVNTRCDISDKLPADRLRPSAIIKRHAHKYRAEVLGANKTIAIMLRVERFLTLKSVEETVESCLEKTLGVYSQLREDPRWSISSPFLTLDIGRYGSGLMQRNETVQRMNASLDSVTASVTQFLVTVYEGRWTSLEEWEDSFLVATEGIAERGYVAMLQRQIAVESDCLVLMGGGSFQEVAANHYLIAHPDPAHQCLHVVCPATALTTSLESSRQRRNKKPAMGRHHH
jgi:hypothetical protein